MSQENVEIARRAFEFEIYARGEAAAIFDPDVVLNPVEEKFRTDTSGRFATARFCP